MKATVRPPALYHRTPRWGQSGFAVFGKIAFPNPSDCQAAKCIWRQSDSFVPDNVLLADRYFSGYFDIATWQQQGVDVVAPLHQRRRCGLRRGRRLGPNDHVVLWTKPPRPVWMEEEDTYARMPEQLQVRKVWVGIAVPGFRSKEKLFVL